MNDQYNASKLFPRVIFRSGFIQITEILYFFLSEQRKEWLLFLFLRQTRK